MSLGWHVICDNKITSVVINLGWHGAVLYGNDAYLDGKNSVWHGTVFFGYKATLDKQNQAVMALSKKTTMPHYWHDPKPG